MSTRKVPGGTRSLSGVLDDPDPLYERIRARTETIVRETSAGIAAAARARAPVLTGALRDGVLDRAVAGPPSQVRRVVGVVGPAARYARFVISSKVGGEARATRPRYFYTEELGAPVRASRDPMAKAIVAAGVEEVKRG